MTRSHLRSVTPITPGHPSKTQGLGFALTFGTTIRILMLIALPAFLFNPAAELPAMAEATTNVAFTIAVSAPHTYPLLAAELGTWDPQSCACPDRWL